MSQPLVSVIMPVYDAEKYLARAIESILGQTYPFFELIIVDDHSTDGSWEIISAFRKQHPDKICAIRSEVPLGYLGEKAANLAIMKAKGSYIAKMDADDISVRSRLALQVEYLQHHADIFLVGSQALVINGNDEIKSRLTFPTHPNDIYRQFYLRNCIIHPSVMFRNQNSREPFYDLRFPYFSDYYTFFKLMASGKRIANLPDFLLHYRVHRHNNTFSKIKATYLTDYQIKRTMVKEFGYKPAFHQKVYLTLRHGLLRFLPERILHRLYQIWIFRVNAIKVSSNTHTIAT